MLQQQSFGGAGQPHTASRVERAESQREALLRPRHRRGATGSSMNTGLGPFELDRWIRTNLEEARIQLTVSSNPGMQLTLICPSL